MDCFNNICIKSCCQWTKNILFFSTAVHHTCSTYIMYIYTHLYTHLYILFFSTEITLVKWIPGFKRRQKMAEMAGEADPARTLRPYAGRLKDLAGGFLLAKQEIHKNGLKAGWISLRPNGQIIFVGICMGFQWKTCRITTVSHILPLVFIACKCLLLLVSCSCCILQICADFSQFGNISLI